VLVNRNPLVETVIGCAIDVHRSIGPGLVESAYAVCLAHELQIQGIAFVRDVAVPIVYEGVRLGCVYRADFVVEGALLIELKSVEQIPPIHHAQVLPEASRSPPGASAQLQRPQAG
jgi:GxxExxY protein